MNKFLLLLFIFQLSIAQKKDDFVNQCYTQTDVLIAKPCLENVTKLEKFIESNRPILSTSKNKNELLAFVYMQCNIGYYKNKFGQTLQAILNYEKAWHVFDKNKLEGYDITEFCLKPLGNLYTIIGDYDAAENTIKHYLYIAILQNNKNQKFASINNLSTVYLSSGKISESIQLLEKTLLDDSLTSTQKGILYNNLGNCFYTNNDKIRATKAFQNSISKLQNQNQTEYLSYSYRNLSLLNNDIKTFETAKKLFFENPKISPRSIAKFYLDEGNLNFNLTHFKESKIAIDKIFKILIPNFDSSESGLPNQKQLYAETILMDALDLKASLYFAENNLKKALDCYKLSFTIASILQNVVFYENSKIILQISSRNRTEKCISIYNLLYQKEHKIAYLKEAFEVSEKNKASVLKNTIDATKTKSATEKLIATQLQNQNTIIIKEQQKLENADISVINKAIKKQNELMLLVKSKAEILQLNANKSIELKAIFSKLEQQKAVLVSYFSGTEKMYVFVLENNQIILKNFDYDAKTISDIKSFIDLFSNSEFITNDISNYTKMANSVYKILLLPKNKINKNLVIIPDGILNFLPFEALITSQSATTNFAKMNYLLKDFSVGYSNSAFFYMNSTAVQNKNQKVLGVFPIFENSSLELTYSKDELKAIQKKFKGKFLINNEATFTNFKKQAPNFEILHLSTHGSSGDLETPASIKFYDQEILYSELYNLNLKASLVVLSACETGLGKLYKSEGAMSISRGFQMAGVQNLLFSLWKVNDFTTSVLMEKFYTNCAKQMSYFDSNHQSKLDYLLDNNISNSKKSPYYWSAFVYYGTLDGEKPTNYFWIIYTFGGFIALFLLYKFIKNDRFSKNIKKR